MAQRDSRGLVLSGERSHQAHGRRPGGAPAPSRLRRAATVAAVVVAVVWLAVTARLFVLPPSAPPPQVDAVVALGGGEGERLDVAVSLVDDGVAPILVVSTGPNDEMRAAGLTCGDEGDFEVVCFAPDPASTAGEARGIAELARSNGWSSIAVVTSSYHVTRSRMLFAQCTNRPVHVVAAPAPQLELRYWFMVAREQVALLWGLTGGRAC